MKKIMTWMSAVLFITFLSTSCSTTEKDSKITDIPATSASAEALAAFKEGVAFMDLGDDIKARAAYTKAIELDPKFGMAYLMRAGSSNSAKEFADDVAAGNANMDSSASMWEKLYAEWMETNLTGNRDKATELVQKIAAEYPDAARVHVYLGSRYAGDNQIDKARASYDKAVSLDPKWVGGYSALITSYLFADPIDLNKAEVNAVKLVELAPQSAGSHITLGDCYRAKNNLEKAKESYTKAIGLDAKAPEGYYKLGHANTYLGNLEEARKNYADAGTYDNKSSSPVLFAAYTYLYADDAKTGCKFIMDKMAANPNMDASRISGCYETAAEIAMHTGDVALLKSAVEKRNSLSAQELSDLGNKEETKLFFKADSLHWQAMIEIAEAKYDLAKNNLEAMKTVLEPIKNNKKLEGYEHDLGLIAMKQKNYGDAVNHFEKASPFSIYNKYMLAKANEGAGNNEKATSLYTELAAYNFNNVDNALIRNEVKKQMATPK